MFNSCHILNSFQEESKVKYTLSHTQKRRKTRGRKRRKKIEKEGETEILANSRIWIKKRNLNKSAYFKN